MAVTRAWQFKCALTVDKTKVSSDTSNGPVLLVHTGATATSNIPDVMMLTGNALASKSDGSDIRFTTDAAGDTECAFEIVSFTQSASLASCSAEIHVLVSSISSSVNTVFYMWWGNSAASAYAATATYGRNATWTDYAAVWHLQTITNSSASVVDSAGNAGTNGTPTSVDTVTGQIKNAGSWNADGDTIAVPTFAAARTASLLTSSHGFAFEFWTKPSEDMDNNGGNRRAIIGKGVYGSQDWAVFFACNQFGQGTAVTYESNTADFELLASNNTAWKANSLYFMGFRVSSTTTGKQYKWNIWEDGASIAGETQKTYTSTLGNAGTDSDLSIGCHYDFASYRGWIDEIRVSEVTRDDNWFTTMFNSQNSPQTFVTYGNVNSNGVRSGAIVYQDPGIFV